MPRPLYSRLAHPRMARAHQYLDARLRREAPATRAPSLQSTAESERSSAGAPWAARVGRKVDFCFGSQGISFLEQADTYHTRNPASSLKWYEVLYRFPADHFRHHGIPAGFELSVLALVFLPPVAMGAALSAAVAFGRGSRKDARLAAVVAATYSATWRLCRGTRGWTPTFALGATGSVSAYLGLPRLNPNFDPRGASVDGAARTAYFVYDWCLPPAQWAASAFYLVSSSAGLIVKAVVWGVAAGCEQAPSLPTFSTTGYRS